jgi:hypothetical protein
MDAFGTMAYKIPAKYEGETIRLEGYMKLENVTAGFAGLLLRLNGQGKVLAFDNMQRQNIRGTTDWIKYSIELPYHEDAENIFVAGLLTGKGKAWFDHFQVFIDNADIQTLDPVVKTPVKAVY